MTTVRIVVGNEPFTYRHVYAEVLRTLRPDVEVVLVDPGELDVAITRHAPHLVVCSALSEAVQTRPLAWVLMHPNGANLAVVSIDGIQRVIQDVRFEDLLAAVDETWRRIAPKPAAGDSVQAAVVP